jgi:hypothetical protein
MDATGKTVTLRRTSDMSRLTASKVKKNGLGLGLGTGSCPPLKPLLMELNNLFTEVQKVVHTFYTIEGVVADFIAEMTGRTFVKPVIFVRLAWREEHPGEYFDLLNPLQRLSLLDIYIRYGLKIYIDLDPLFKDDMGCMLYHNLRDSGALDESSVVGAPPPTRCAMEAPAPVPVPVPAPVPAPVPVPVPKKVEEIITLPPDIDIRGPGAPHVARGPMPVRNVSYSEGAIISMDYIKAPQRKEPVAATGEVAETPPELVVKEPEPVTLPYITRMPSRPVELPPPPAPRQAGVSATVLTTRPPPKRREIGIPRRELPPALPPRPVVPK